MKTICVVIKRLKGTVKIGNKVMFLRRKMAISRETAKNNGIKKRNTWVKGRKRTIIKSNITKY